MALQGRKRRAPVDEDEDMATPTQTRHEDTPMEDEDDEYESQQSGSGSIAQLSKSLVRYALACEYARIPIKRQDVSQKVLGSHSRAFKQVFDAANGQLLDTFGMELVELPNKEKVTTRQKRAAVASESQTKVTTSNQWVLRNVLPDAFRAPAVISPPSAPTAEVESAYVGLYTTIISLIMLSGGTLSEQKLDRYFRRMNIEQSTPVDSTDKALARMIKEGYIVKVKDYSGDETVDWMVGPRGKVEVGDEGVRQLVQSVYGADAGEELEQKLARSLGLTEGVSAQQEGVVSGGRRRGRPRRGHEDEDG